MKKKYLCFILLLLKASIATAADQIDIAQLKAEADEIAKQYVSTLKPQLKNAIQSGGFAHAVEVCSTTAPMIAADLSKRTGWSVKRVSLKPRNKPSAKPDAYEEIALKVFDQRVEKEPTIKNLVHYDVVDHQFRYLKAQRVDGLCLSCHGDAVAPEISANIQRLYPEDIATGYRQGQVRGAISLSLNLPEAPN